MQHKEVLMQAYFGIAVLAVVVAGSMYFGFLKASERAPRGTAFSVSYFIMYSVSGIVGAYAAIIVIALALWVFALIGIWLREVIIWFIGAVLWPISVILPF